QTSAGAGPDRTRRRADRLRFGGDDIGGQYRGQEWPDVVSRHVSDQRAERRQAGLQRLYVPLCADAVDEQPDGSALDQPESRQEERAGQYRRYVRWRELLLGNRQSVAECQEVLGRLPGQVPGEGRLVRVVPV